MCNKKFWNTVLISNEKELVELFNQNYETKRNSPGKKLSSLRDCLNASQDELTIKEIISVYRNHPSIQKVESVFKTDSKFDLPKPTASDINKIIKSLDSNKATGPDGSPGKFVQMLASVIGCHLSSIITCDISKIKYSEHAKTATVRPIFKTDDRKKIKNYWLVSLLNVLSKIYERFLHENLTNYVNAFLSHFFSAYRKSYSTNHVLIHLIENWEKSREKKRFVGAVLMDLSKALTPYLMIFS